MQGRDEEIESLTEILEKRDEELEHVKILATKAIAQAQEIQNRYKEKGARDSDRKADLAMKIDSMNISMQFLTEKNKELQDKVTRLEQELEDKELECAMLKRGVLHGLRTVGKACFFRRIGERKFNNAFTKNVQ